MRTPCINDEAESKVENKEKKKYKNRKKKKKKKKTDERNNAWKEMKTYDTLNKEY